MVDRKGGGWKAERRWGKVDGEADGKAPPQSPQESGYSGGRREGHESRLYQLRVYGSGRGAGKWVLASPSLLLALVFASTSPHLFSQGQRCVLKDTIKDCLKCRGGTPSLGVTKNFAAAASLTTWRVCGGVAGAGLKERPLKVFRSSG